VDIAPGCTVPNTHSNIFVTKYLCCVDGSQQVGKNVTSTVVVDDANSLTGS